MVLPEHMGDYAVVVAGGDVSDLLLPFILSASLRIAADSGAEFLVSHGIEPDLLVGDFDSCSGQVVQHVKAGHSRVLTLPVDKDVTDTEAALDAALKEAYKTAAVVGALGGRRVEHGIANLFLIESYAKRGMDVILMSPTTCLCHVSGNGFAGIARRAFRGIPGDWVSLFPITATVSGVSTRELKFPLSGATLRRGATLGVSNQMLKEKASVSAEKGFLAIALTSALASK